MAKREANNAARRATARRWLERSQEEIGRKIREGTVTRQDADALVDALPDVVLIEAGHRYASRFLDRLREAHPEQWTAAVEALELRDDPAPLRAAIVRGKELLDADAAWAR